MKKIIISLLLLIIAGAAFVGYKNKRQIKFLLLSLNSKAVEKNVSEPVLALFSFQPEFQPQTIDSFAHFTIKIENINRIKLKKKVIASIPENTPLLLTIKIWGKSQLTAFSSNPLEEMVRGEFDESIKKMCSQFIGSRQNVYVRYNPEMEVPVTKFPWQLSGGKTYIEAFQHFSEIVKKYAPQAKIVWGPAGYPGAMEYYPGDEFVDAATVTLKSDSELPLKVYPDYQLDYNLYRRLHRLRFIDKPIFVLGSKNAANDSVSEQVVRIISQKIEAEKYTAYSNENFKRPDLSTQKSVQGEIEIGLYDPQSLLINEPPVTTEHLFVDFGSLASGVFQTGFNKVLERGHKVIVTFEPFRIPGREDDLQVLQNTIAGKYNREIEKFYSIISSTKQRVYLRFAHEMEIPITRYPWQSQDPVTYIKSFRYFMSFKTPFPSNIKRVWGPAGDRGSIEWWPGNDVVDFVSVAIYGLPDKNITDPEKQETFSTIFYRKYWRVRLIDKPIFIAEFGVKGPEEYQTKWLTDAAKVIKENPQIVGVNYFNMSDTPKAWGDIKPPDWSITKNTFYIFTEILKKQE